MSDKYDVFIIDPPWGKKKGGKRGVRPNQGKQLSYNTMASYDIFKLLDKDIFSQAQENHTVFMWVIDEFFLTAEEEMKNRGYHRHARMIWDKCNGVAPCFTVRFTHEYLIWYYKPKLMKVAEDQRGRFGTVFREQAREHSRKPEISYQMVEMLYPEAKRLDVFSRTPRAGWDQFGNEPDGFDAVAWGFS